MKLVVDANILFSIAKIDSATNKIIFDKNPQLFSPYYALDELRKYSKLIEDKYKINFENYLTKLKTQIKFIQSSEYNEKISSAKKIITDTKDTAYFALALKYKIPIWSNDSEFKKQNTVLVFNTMELINLL
jgi:predicted nucleic acid-binding protein